MPQGPDWDDIYNPMAEKGLTVGQQSLMDLMETEGWRGLRVIERMVLLYILNLCRGTRVVPMRLKDVEHHLSVKHNELVHALKGLESLGLLKLKGLNWGYLVQVSDVFVEWSGFDRLRDDRVRWSTLSLGQARLLRLLMGMQAETGDDVWFEVSLRRVSALMYVSREAVSDWVGYLEGLGYLEVRRRKAPKPLLVRVIRDGIDHWIEPMKVTR